MKLIPSRVERVVDATPEQLWPVVSDTDRRNRVTREFFPLRFEPIESLGPQRQLALTRLGPFTATYEEAPAQFIANESVTIERTFRSGPFHVLRVISKLQPTGDEGKTRVSFEIAAAPRWWWFRPVLPFMLAHKARSLMRFVLERLPNLTRPPREPKARIAASALDRAREDLLVRVDPAQHPIAEKLVDFVREAPDVELVRIRPFALADAWGVNRDEVLGMCLQASLAGLLELRWDTVCPSCQTGSASVPTLAEIGTEGHCQLCDLRFDLELDRAVEAVFRSAQSVRAVPPGPFCLASPSRFPNVLIQAHFPPDAPLELRVPPVEGRLRLFIRGGQFASVLVEPGAPAEVKLTLGEGAPLPSQISVAPGGFIRLLQHGPKTLHVKLERLVHLDDAATAHVVTTNALFRRFFSQELLKPGLALSIARVALVFTDLTGSTAMYSRLGEPTAFRIVLDHFELLRGIIERHGGSIVKTIGDAVMASFPDELAAMRASVEMIDAFPNFASERPQAEGLGLKVGTFTGPAYVVRANESLDYFGQTVNTAARVQGEAGSDELITSEELARRAVEAGVLESARVGPAFEKTLKGLPAPLRLVKVRALESR